MEPVKRPTGNPHESILRIQPVLLLTLLLRPPNFLTEGEAKPLSLCRRRHRPALRRAACPCFTSERIWPSAISGLVWNLISWARPLAGATLRRRPNSQVDRGVGAIFFFTIRYLLASSVASETLSTGRGILLLSQLTAAGISADRSFVCGGSTGGRLPPNKPLLGEPGIIDNPSRQCMFSRHGKK